MVGTSLEVLKQIKKIEKPGNLKTVNIIKHILCNNRKNRVYISLGRIKAVFPHSNQDRTMKSIFDTPQVNMFHQKVFNFSFQPYPLLNFLHLQHLFSPQGHCPLDKLKWILHYRYCVVTTKLISTFFSILTASILIQVPKSASFRCPCLSKSILSGFTSLKKQQKNIN
jgi:hypothetical protein